MNTEITAAGEDTVVERAALAPGEVVAGKYVVSRFVGAGGMAQVFEALNRDIDERVALKLMHPAFRSDAGFAAKFRMEARAAARIRSESVARVFDVVSTDAGDPVIVMEFLDGLDLRSWIETHGLPSVEVAVGWMIEACAGLAVAHANGIVHRDVKPENLFIAHEIGGREQLKLLDFGVSRAALAYNPTKVGSGQHGAMRLNGTPSYMAPEQVTSSRAADPRMDVWAVGVLLFELLAGETPFPGTTPEEICLAILENRRSDLRKLRPELPEDLVRTIDFCLAPKPEGRLSSVADIAVALSPFARPSDAISVDRTVTLLRTAGLTVATVPPERRSHGTPLPPAVSATPASAPAPPALVLTSLPPSGPPSGAAPVSAPPTSPPSVVDPLPTAPLPNTSRKGYAVAALLLLLAIGGAVLFLRSPPTGSAAAQPSSAPAPAPAAFTAIVASTPAGAAITVDGAAHGVSPKAISFTAGTHIVTVELPGFMPATRSVDIGEAQAGTTLSFDLAPAAVASAPPTPAPTPTEAASSKPRVSSRYRGEPKPGPTPTATTTNNKPNVQILPDGTSNVKVIE